MVQLTVKGFEVQLDEIKDYVQIELDFKDLNEAGQQRVFSENEKLFLAEALKSQNTSVRKSAEHHLKEFSSEFLNKYIMELLKSRTDDNDLIYSFQIKTILMKGKFKLNQETIDEINKIGDKTIRSTMVIYHPEAKEVLEHAPNQTDSNTGESVFNCILKTKQKRNK